MTRNQSKLRITCHKIYGTHTLQKQERLQVRQCSRGWQKIVGKVERHEAKQPLQTWKDPRKQDEI